MKKFILQMTLVISTLLMVANVKAQCPTITCLNDTVVNNDSGLCSAVVNYAAPFVIDSCAIIRDTLFYSGAIVNWTVPTGVTNLSIEARGAEGSNNTSSGVPAGLGAIMMGDFTVNPGDVFKVLVGQQYTNTLGNGGGGGTFVTDISNNPLIVAGGGGGSSQDTDSPNKHGQVGTTGGTGAGGGGIGGSAGNGGSIGASFASGAGAGLLTNGADGWTAASGGFSFLNGGSGGTANTNAQGGFGGGGSGSSYVVGGGGGGYSGGGSGSNSAGSGVGGGGASFNSGTNQNNSGGANSGHGMVVFTYTNSSTLTVTQLAGLASGSNFPVGVTTNTFEVSNGTQMDTCSFNVTVIDTTLPIITCPSNVTTCDSVVTGISPTTSDNCGNETVAYLLSGATTGSGNGDASGTIFNVGITNVQYTVTDTSGNVEICSFDVEVQSCVGVNENSLNNMEIYPNPTNSTVSINLKKSIINAEYMLTSIEGKVVQQDRFSGTQLIIDLHNEPKGVYFLKIENKVMKLIKE
ncbi:MAG: HYR domain-containing protein [Vicingaceae bacterium]|nr:HYR domain-containing protein [Vicingaceae bacterium]